MKLLVLTFLCFCISTTLAAGQNGCCTSYSKASAVLPLVWRRLPVLCVEQQIGEYCNIRATILKTRCRLMCVNPNNKEIKQLLEILCSRKNAANGRKIFHCPPKKKLEKRRNM